MGFEYIQRIPKVDEIMAEMPLPEDLFEVKKAKDKEVADIFLGKSDKFLLIIGPCSADNEDSVCEYINRIAKVQDKVKDKLVIVPRVYTNKPRTTGKGYKGMSHQPDPNEAPNIVEGLRAIRKMHIRIIRETGLSAADEMLYPENYPYLEDVLSYVAVGARSVENQQHRLTVSGLDVPIGMKNPTSGDINVMLNSIQAAQLRHTFIYNGWEVNTPGNPLAHGVLRGCFTQYGRSIPNYHYEELIRVAEMYRKRDLNNPAIIVDTNHANSGKVFEEQPRIASNVMYYRRKSDVISNLVKGLMVESYLVEGSQDPSGGEFGQSITDPCLGWEDSEKLIYYLAERV